MSLNRHVGRSVRESMRPDTPEQIAERVAHRAAGDQAQRECQERWPTVTAETFRTAIEWQTRRIAELMEEWQPRLRRWCQTGIRGRTLADLMEEWEAQQ